MSWSITKAAALAAVCSASLAAVAISSAGAQEGTKASSSSTQPPPLSAQASDPRVMGWMQGFPPPPDKIIRQPQSDYFSFPKLRWSVCHLRQFLPTVRISRGIGDPVPLAYAEAPMVRRRTSEINALTLSLIHI